jgi:hypothetical protein
MNTYSIALFLHIVGALGFFVALGLEWTGLRQIRRATNTEQLREWMRIINTTRRVGGPSMLLILITGFYMTAIARVGAAWISVTLGAIVLLIVVGAALSGPRMAALGKALSNEQGFVSHNLQNLANHPLLWVSMQTRLWIALGIIFLMAVKPDLAGSLLAICIAAVVGLATALPIPRRKQTQTGSAD